LIWLNTAFLDVGKTASQSGMEVSMKWFKHSLIILSIVLGSSAQAYEAGNIASGLNYAEAVCAECHAVKKGQRTSPHERATAFETVANARGMSPMALRVWFQSPHPSMPNLVLKEKTADDLIAYIMSLKQGSRTRGGS
jgi:mono/diheme cytochrome c family protein